MTTRSTPRGAAEPVAAERVEHRGFTPSGRRRSDGFT